MISVTEALEKLFLIAKVTPVETLELKKCLGRVLAKPLESTRSNPPFPSSAMDGYAINKANLKSGAEFKVIGESAAGHSYPKKIKSKPNREVLRLEMVSYKSDHDLDVKINNLNLKLYGGEIIGIAGVAGNGQQSLAKLLTGHLKPTEGKIFINHEKIKYTIPIIIHYTEGSISTYQEDEKLFFEISHPDKWSFTKITITNSKSGNTETLTATPEKKPSMKIYENGEYWIEAKIMSNGKTTDAFDVININSVSEKTEVLELRNIPEKQVMLIISIIVIVGIIGLLIRK